MEQKETTLWDVLRSCAKGIVRIVEWFVQLVAKMLRLSFQRWWLVGGVMLLCMAAGFYYSRPANKLYKVSAIATLNGPSVSEVKSFYESLHKTFDAFCVIDCLNDGVADYVDYGRKNPLTDTLQMVMKDQIAFQFVTRNRKEIPWMEERIMYYLNTNQQFVEEYQIFKKHADRQYRFDCEQVDKLDSMTAAFYADANVPQIQSNAWTLAMGRKEIILPLRSIEEFMENKAKRDSRYALVTAPVVLHGHFEPARKAVNGRLKCTATGLIVGWLLGCLIAAFFDERRRIIRWLRQK
ncbi:MAG: hypothetical protein J6Y00_07005 [Paludibacteraceae bacterium]|nr:hypothetical protein [Paludibacteraceae bacterium]